MTSSLMEFASHPWVVALSLALGSGLIVHGVRRALRARHVEPGPTVELGRLIWLGRGMRALLVGLGLVGLGFGGLYEVRWLVLVSLAFAGEELYEVTMGLALLRHIEETERNWV